MSNYNGFGKYRFNILALFDVDKSKADKYRKVPIYLMDELEEFMSMNRVDIAAITVPREYAVETAKKVCSYGVKAIWNFAQVDLNDHLTEDVIVQNVHLAESLMQLSYNIAAQSKENF